MYIIKKSLLIDPKKDKSIFKKPITDGLSIRVNCGRPAGKPGQ
jgi:hypothetical protein